MAKENEKKAPAPAPQAKGGEGKGIPSGGAPKPAGRPGEKREMNVPTMVNGKELRGIVRMADATVPMDETLVTVAVDISGRGYPVLKMDFDGDDIAGLPTELIKHFLESFAIEARMNLHASILYGSNDHHKAEAVFKALGRALDAATRIDPRIAGELPTTKAFLA